MFKFLKNLFGKNVVENNRVSVRPKLENLESRETPVSFVVSQPFVNLGWGQQRVPTQFSYNFANENRYAVLRSNDYAAVRVDYTPQNVVVTESGVKRLNQTFVSVEQIRNNQFTAFQNPNLGRVFLFNYGR